MWHTPSIYDNILTIHQQDEVNDLIRQAIETNDDPSTTDADIRYFEMQEYMHCLLYTSPSPRD